jgi:hypothetical protein
VPNTFSVFLLLLALLAGGCVGPQKAPARPTVPSTSDRHEASVYILSDGGARPLDFLKPESNGLNHATIIGAVERPGVYYFNGKVPLEAVVSAASPIKRESSCGSACLDRVQIMSSKRLPEDATFTVNYEKYLDLRSHNPGHAPWELNGGEVIHISEWF